MLTQRPPLIHAIGPDDYDPKPYTKRPKVQRRFRLHDSVLVPHAGTSLPFHR